jgi:osomolarity two-component system response regulator SKN7
VCSSTHLSNTAEAEDIIEIPEAQQQTLYNGEPMGVTPVFVETPAWLTENTTAPIPIYHRKSSDGLTLRLMVEALAGQGEPRFDGTQDPLDMSPRHDQRLHDNHAGSSSTSPGLAGSRAVGVGSSSSTAENMPSIQQAPFGTLIIPAPSSASSSGDNTGGNPVRIRRSSTIRPHWNKAPRILVVEDDVVYRQLSSKFLEKFGCVTETVENAQGAVEKMNRTKYDLVLMDIFFGPNMDG